MKYRVYFRLFGNGEWIEDTLVRKSLNAADKRGWRLHDASCDLQIAHGQFEWEIRDQSGVVYIHNGKWE